MVGEFGDLLEPGAAELFGEVGKDADQFHSLSVVVPVPLVETFGPIVIEFIPPAFLGVAGEGAEELGDGGELTGFSEVYGLDDLAGGEEIEDDQDLLFGEDAFLFAF